MKHRLLALLLAGTTVTACSTTRHTTPAFDSVSLPPLALSVFADHPVHVDVLDHRAERPDSESLVRTTKALLEQALIGAGRTVSADGTATLEVRIRHYRADFELGNWNGVVHLQGTVNTPSSRHVVPVERLVKKSNMWGYESGDEAVQQAYADALAELLSKVDDLHTAML